MTINLRNIFVCSIVILFQPVQNMAAAMDFKHLYCVILAGGDGTRLWPLSRAQMPKQLLEIDDHQSLLDQAIARVEPLTVKENIWVCTTARHAQAIKKSVADQIGTILVEPGARNTGPAILLSCLEIYQKDPQAFIIFLPADPYIAKKDNKKFVQFLEHACHYSYDTGHITLLGVQPTFAATGYGYIKPCLTGDFQVPVKIEKFCEKPSRELANQYLESKSMLWNIGIFCASAQVFIEQFKLVAPQIYQGVMDYRAGKITYDEIHADSIDYAVLEKSDKVSVLPVDFGWCDVGNLEIFLTIKNQNKKLAHQPIEIESKNNLVDVLPHTCVALVGVEDLCIVQTDSILLITKRSEAEKVRAVVNELKKGNFQEYL